MAAYPTTYVNRKGQTVSLPNPSRSGLTYGVRTNNLVQGFDSGHEERRKKGAPKNTFEFSYLYLDKEAALTLRTFFLARSGNVESFSWTDPVMKVAYPKVRFDMDTFVMENVTHNDLGPLFKVSIKLIEDF